MKKEIKNLLQISKIYGHSKGYFYYLTPFKETLIIKNNKLINRYKENNKYILKEFREEFFKQTSQ